MWRNFRKYLYRDFLPDVGCCCCNSPFPISLVVLTESPNFLDTQNKSLWSPTISKPPSRSIPYAKDFVSTKADACLPAKKPDTCLIARGPDSLGTDEGGVLVKDVPRRWR